MSQTMQTTLLFIEMAVIFAAAQRFFKLSTVLSLLLAAIIGSLSSGFDISTSLHHIIEGSFTFLYIALIIITGTLFVEVQKESGAFNAMVRELIIRFHRYPKVLLVLLMFLIILPGALTGPGAAGVIALGGIVAPVLLSMGIPLSRVVAFLAIGGVLGDFAPPINIPAMIISSGINMPYVGFFIPLIVLTLFLTVTTSLFVGAKHVKGQLDLDEMLKPLPVVPEKMTGIRIIAPLLVFALLMIIARVFPHRFPPMGVPLMFLIGTAVAFMLAGKMDFLKLSSDVVKRTLPVTGILIAVGPLVQVMSATGVKGLFVITAITVPALILYAALFIGLPLSGSVLGTLGAASILGVPFMLALLGRDPIIATIGISLIAALATLTPPTAITGKAAIMVTDFKESYATVLKHCLPPLLAIDVIGILMVIFADKLSFLIK
jgi:TRAP-type C4-dicarboxylate transport system permease large subunit